MAPVNKAVKTYDISGGVLREDLADVIYDISPMDTFFMSNVGRGTAQSTTHEWLSDTLGAVATAFAVEGDAFSAQARATPTRLKNYCGITKREIEVTGTARKVNSAGIRELMAYEVAKAGKEIKRDMESLMLGNNPASAGTTASARVSGGVPNWITDINHIKLGTQNLTTTTALASGFPTASGASWGTTTSALAEADLKSALQKAWSAGGEVGVILTGSTLYNSISGFTGIATRFRDVAAGRQAEIIGAADVYVSAFGRHAIQLSRWIPSGYLYCLDMAQWEVDYLRPFEVLDIAKVGDSDRKTLLAEWTLRAKAPRANTKIVGAT